MKKLFIGLLLLCSLMSYSQAGDCPALCIASDIASTTAVAGSTDELNPTNGSCLSANEATSSYWYQVCFSSAGTFAFTMNPSGNKNDFDFAVWNGRNCPPTAAPLRCSFAATPIIGGTDLTGLGNGATDLVEDASGDQWVAPINVTNGQCITLNINNFGNGSSTFSLDFTGTATMTCAPLPITMTSFDASRDGTVVKLRWITQTEINNDYYEVQRSKDATDFQVIGKRQGKGSTSTSSVYLFDDIDPDVGYNYYRLRQVDFDGMYTYSKIVACPYDNNENVVIYDLIGREVYNGKRSDNYNLPKGLYIMNKKNLLIE